MPMVHTTAQPVTDSNDILAAETGISHKKLQRNQHQSLHHSDTESLDLDDDSSTSCSSSSATDLTSEDPTLDKQHAHFCVQLPQAHGPDSHQQDHRPDSPTSLEDSQSESGVDLFPADSASIERPMPRFPNGNSSTAATASVPDSKLAVAQHHNMMIHTELANSLAQMSPSQVATPPLSPVKIPSENDRQLCEDEEEAGVEDEPATAVPRALSEDYAKQENEAQQETMDTSGLDGAKENNDEDEVEVEAPAEPSTSTVVVPPPSVPTPIPKISAWSTLLPGVAPIPAPRPPAPKPAARTPAARKSDDLRLHERFPIVLPHEYEAKLSMDMVDLFENLLPTEESHDRRTKLIKKIEYILETEWPGQDIQAHPFGSTVNDLGTSSSDVDICIMTTWSGMKNVQMLANAFRKHGMQKVFCVPRAKVPIVKLWDPELHLSCDMNINTPLGLLNTRMIKTYVAIDPRVRPFAMIIKHWARRRVLNDAANGGTISTYTWICIVINFLQMRSPPILPKLHQMPHTLSDDNQVINGNNTSFCSDLEQLEGFGLPNKETLGGLLYAFFRRFAIEFDYDNHVISVREGCYLTKESKGWHLPGKQYKLFCVEEPFDTSRNLGNSSDMTSSKGLKEEFKRALEILHQKVSLNDCCEQFVFPASYYHNNSNTRKGSNGTVIHNNYAPGRRYANGYRTQNNYYDDDYDDDEEEEGIVPSEVSVMETLNIGTRPSHSRDPTGSSKQHREAGSSSSGRGENGGGLSKSSASKDGSAGGRSNEPSSQRSQSRNRAKQSGKGEKEGAIDGSRSAGSSRNSKQEKSGTGGSSSSTSGQRNKKSSNGNGGDRQKNGRGSSNGAASGSGGRTPRATVEFSLADIANAAPKLLSNSTRAEQASSPLAGDNAVGSGVGEEDAAKSKRKGRRNVVWSTNSNRGESSRRHQPATKNTQLAEHEKAKVIFMASEEEPSSSSGTLTPSQA